ncbi:hypothetical protein D7M11_13875 [Paenibacillus ginsengarvi]|uniref:NTP pyrophosphohydrolase MazG-like domain-containing protein n=2 Tax=Paenibacillus ginsengarvi TaxID=400777 RepID=A0A3B0CIC9_9BACL|nr:hypothetical protein D7M11_13875 [Paenibacillus ginsengarvi]
MTISGLQAYIRNKDHNPDNKIGYFYKLIEEVGELSEMIRNNSRAEETGTIKGTIEEELCDVLYYTVALANVYQIDLEERFRQKEELNKIKWGK